MQASAAIQRYALLCLCLLTIGASALAQNTPRNYTWSEATHGRGADINYELVLPNDRVNEMTIIFSPESWAAEEADMTEIYGERGSGGRRGAAQGPQDVRAMLAEVADKLDRSESQVMSALRRLPDFNAAAKALDLSVSELMAALPLPGGTGMPAQAGMPRGGQGGRMENMQLARNPIWTPVTIEFADGVWEEVGFRYKGNSTLSMGWDRNEAGLPFKLDFDEFEDDNPALDNQRFYGFKQLTFSRSLVIDSSQQREKVAPDVFRAAGVPAPETAFYAVHVDKGDGAGKAFWGIYTAMELPDDTLIETQFADDNGNMYKPGGHGASFARGAFDEASFDKETNRDSDYSDVLAVFDALHDGLRQSDPAAWRAGLEAVFDVDGFLRWLAVNTLIQNWDTYGNLPHNYYLYADEASGALAWIPWDNNMALSSGASTPGGVPGFMPPLALSLDDVDAGDHPLIGFLVADPVYHSRYVELVARAADVFEPERMASVYEANFEMLSAYLRDVGADESLSDMRRATFGLVTHAKRRAAAVEAFLATVG